MKYDRRVEITHDGPRVIYYLQEKDALGLADYSQADKIRQAELDRKWQRAFKKAKAFGVSAPKDLQNAPRREPDR